MTDVSDKSGDITIPRRELMQLAQQIHQEYHLRFTWQDCPMGACERFQSLLGVPETQEKRMVRAEIVCRDGCPHGGRIIHGRCLCDRP